MSRDGVVEIPGAEFSAPCVEFPIGDGEGTAGVFHEDRAVVAAPYVVIGMIEEFDVCRIGLGVLAGGGDVFVGIAGGVDTDDLRMRDGSCDLSEF